MLNVGALREGYVLDHIKAGKSMKIYNYLELDKLDCVVAVIKNVPSRKMGKKDIIKIDAEIDVDLDILGYIDPGITVDVIKDGKLIDKRHLELPQTVSNVMRCKNPRCITSTEQGLTQTFKLADKENGIYRCIYCESRAKHGSLL